MGAQPLGPRSADVDAGSLTFARVDEQLARALAGRHVRRELTEGSVAQLADVVARELEHDHAGRGALQRQRAVSGLEADDVLGLHCGGS